MTRPWKCSCCGRGFGSPQGVKDHGRAKHPDRQVTAGPRPRRDRETVASRAVNALLDRAMGLPLDPGDAALLDGMDP